MTRYCKQLLVVLARLHPLSPPPSLEYRHRRTTPASTVAPRSRCLANRSPARYPTTSILAQHTARAHEHSRRKHTHSSNMAADMDIDFTRRNKKPRPLSEHEKEKLDEFVDAIHYSAR